MLRCPVLSSRCTCPVPPVLRYPVFKVWTLWVLCADVSRLPGVDALGPFVLGYPIFQVDAVGPPVLRCPVFQAYLIPASLSAASMRYTPEFKKSPPHLLKKFAGNMEEAVGLFLWRI